MQKPRKFYNADSASALCDFPARDFGRNKRCIQINIPLQTKLKQACCECCRDRVVVDEHQRLSNKNDLAGYSGRDIFEQLQLLWANAQIVALVGLCSKIFNKTPRR
jgi:hypothetical protein